MSNQPVATSYSAKDITVLEGLEPVRRRPGMYIGGTDDNAMHHLFSELIDNSFDEATAGHADHIKIEFWPNDNKVMITDNGRGIPVDDHPSKPGTSALEVIMTTLHSGGKFSDKAYQTAGGLHGVGLSVVNALSSDVDVVVRRDGSEWYQSYSRGNALGALKKGKKTKETGTGISFIPDPEIFGNIKLSGDRLFRMCRNKAYLVPKLTVHWFMYTDAEDIDVSENPDRAPKEAIIHFPNGIVDALNHQVGTDPDLAAPIWSGECAMAEGGRIEWAIAWLRSGRTVLKSYCNTIITPLGGTHESGMRNAILKGLKTFGEHSGNNKVKNISMEDVDASISGVISCFIKEPQFQGQTKDKLTNPGVSKIVEQAVRHQIDHYLALDPKQANNLLEAIIEKAELRLAAKKDEGSAPRKTATRRLRLPGKLADCSSSNIGDTELFLVEGDSAGGSAKQARNRETQAILPLRGKILNVASASNDKLSANREIKDLVEALGCGTGRHFDITKLRYGRVIIMTDADVDGSHIATLLITFFYQEMPGLIRTGRLFLAQPPLFRISVGDKSMYVANDAERDRVLEIVRKNNRKAEVSRFKGLGEMPPAMLKETTMDVKKRHLLRVVIEEGEEASTNNMINRLMGRNPEERFKFIQESDADLTRINI